MTTTSTHWHSIDGLTTNQADRLAQREQLWINDGHDPTTVRRHLFEDAMAHRAANIVDREQFGHIPTPDGATDIGHWEDDGTGAWSRELEATRWNVGALTATIVGIQHEDGGYEWRLLVVADGLEFIPCGAERLAEVMAEAATELNRLNEMNRTDDEREHP